MTSNRMYEVVRFGTDAPVAGPFSRAEAMQAAEMRMPSPTDAFETVWSEDEPNEPDGGTVHVGRRNTDLSLDDPAAVVYEWTVRPCQ